MYSILPQSLQLNIISYIYPKIQNLQDLYIYEFQNIIKSCKLSLQINYTLRNHFFNYPCFYCHTFEYDILDGFNYEVFCEYIYQHDYCINCWYRLYCTTNYITRNMPFYISVYGTLVFCMDIDYIISLSPMFSLNRLLDLFDDVRQWSNRNSIYNDKHSFDLITLNRHETFEDFLNENHIIL